MAEEELAPQEGAGDEEVIEDDLPEVQEDDTPDPVADLARELGWAPKEEFRGDPEKWRPADEFIREGRNIQRSMSDKLRGLEETQSRIARISEQLISDKVAERDAYWQQQLDKAVDDGDHEAARKATAELRKASQPSQEASVPAESAAWIARNEWFEKDPLAKALAVDTAERFKHLPVAQQLEMAERAVKRDFPEHFKQPAKQPPATQTGATRKAVPSNRKKGFADMPADYQKVAREMVDRNPSLTLENFANSYWRDMAQQQARRA